MSGIIKLALLLSIVSVCCGLPCHGRSCNSRSSGHAVALPHAQAGSYGFAGSDDSESCSRNANFNSAASRTVFTGGNYDSDDADDNDGSDYSGSWDGNSGGLSNDNSEVEVRQKSQQLADEISKHVIKGIHAKKTENRANDELRKAKKQKNEANTQIKTARKQQISAKQKIEAARQQQQEAQKKLQSASHRKNAAQSHIQVAQQRREQARRVESTEASASRSLKNSIQALTLPATKRYDGNGNAARDSDDDDDVAYDSNGSCDGDDGDVDADANGDAAAAASASANSC